jgi:2,3-bisphosphoglycerate-independent phosphoglycerate mutase
VHLRPAQIRFAGMMQYDGELKLPSHFLVPPPLIEKASEQYVVGTGLRVFACSESQKIGGWEAQPCA